MSSCNQEGHHNVFFGGEQLPFIYMSNRHVINGVLNEKKHVILRELDVNQTAHLILENKTNININNKNVDI